MTSFMPSLDQFIVWIVVRLVGGRPPLAVGMPGKSPSTAGGRVRKIRSSIISERGVVS
jgi:hypothetical protein